MIFQKWEISSCDEVKEKNSQIKVKNCWKIKMRKLVENFETFSQDISFN